MITIVLFQRTNTLFDIWIRFEHRIPRKLYYEKLIKLGDFLTQLNEHFTALWQCYDRYLNNFSSFNFDSIQTSQDIKLKYFSQNPTESVNPDETYKALHGFLMCRFQLTINQDPKLQNDLSSHTLKEILRVLRLMISMQLENEHLCWLVFNGTIYTYKIARYMMHLGFSKIVSTKMSI